MARADKWRKIVDRYRGLPDHYGLREYTVKVLNIAYTGALPGDGTLIDDEYPIRDNAGRSPKVRFPSQKEIALGMAGLGSCVIGPITPFYGSGGVHRELIDTIQSQNFKMLQLWVQGPNFPHGVAMRIDRRQVDRALQIVLECLVVEESA